MSGPYAAGKKAFGFCDKCGFRVKLADLKKEVVNMEETGILACWECWDGDHPQNLLGRYPADDPQALRSPRPDGGQTESRWGNSTVWNFSESVEDWRYVNPSGGDNTVSWNSADGTMTATQTVAGIGSLEYYQSSSSVGAFASIDLDAAVAAGRSLDTVRLVLSLEDSAFSDMGTWDGRFYWGTTTTVGDFPFAVSRRVAVAEPDWNKSMGDRYVTLEYDLSNHANWTGTITSLRFDLYDTSSDFKSFRVSSVRVEEN